MAGPVRGAGAPVDREEELAHVSWTDPNYPHALTRFTALHYFEQSPFFEAASNNTLARQQGRDPAVVGALEFVAPAGGLEFAVELEQPPHLFVIRKQQRRGVDGAAAGATQVLAAYYILDKVIYQAPTLQAVLTTRLQRCVWNLQRGFEKLKADLEPLSTLVQDHEQRAAATAAAQQLAATQIAPPGPAKLEVEPGGDVVMADRPHASTEQGGLQGSSTPVVGSATAPAPLGRAVTPEQAAHWKRTDNMILTVLSSYKIPELPEVYYKGLAADGSAAVPGAQQSGQPLPSA